MHIMPPFAVIAPTATITDNTISLSTEDFGKFLYVFLQNAPFDEEWYVRNYPDVAELIATGELLSGVVKRPKDQGPV